MTSLLRAIILAPLFALLLHDTHAAGADILRKSLVRIQTVSQEPDYSTPWNPGSVGQGVGAGFVISDGRVMTNAHVVSNARRIWITREGDSNRYPAKVLHVGHDCDLAVIQPLNKDFFKSMEPLEFGGIPEIESTVRVYGYPIGGDSASVTRGIVSRIEFQDYSHSGADAHLVVQIDAAINPGNSGGPVVQDDRVVGVAFQGYSGDIAQSTGYMIPTPVIKRFLTDIADGAYDRYVDLAITTFPLYNPAARHALGLADDSRGVMVSSIFGGGSSTDILQPRDVILAIDGHSVASDGTLKLDGSNVQMAEIVERKFKGDKVELDIIREGKPMKVTVPLEEPFPFTLFAYSYDVKPRFLVFGGLVFQPLNEDFSSVTQIKNPRTRYYYDHFLQDNLYKERPEIVILSRILSDPVNAYAEEFYQAIVDKVNGTPVRTLDELAAALAKPAEAYVIEFLGSGRPLVLEAAAVEAARERIRERYGVRKESNLKS